MYGDKRETATNWRLLILNIMDVVCSNTYDLILHFRSNIAGATL